MSTLTAGEIKIAVIGRGKVGKSLLVERIINSKLQFDNPSKNYRQKPLSKKINLLPSGPEILVNIASIEEKGRSSEETIEKCLMAISESGITIMVLDARFQLDDNETFLITYLRDKQIPFLIAINKIEFGTSPSLLTELDAIGVVYFEISCKENAGLERLKKKMIQMLSEKAMRN